VPALPRGHHFGGEPRQKTNWKIEVVNFWPNRIIGDASLPLEQRLTRTNIRN